MFKLFALALVAYQVTKGEAISCKVQASGTATSAATAAECTTECFFTSKTTTKTPPTDYESRGCKNSLPLNTALPSAAGKCMVSDDGSTRQALCTCSEASCNDGNYATRVTSFATELLGLTGTTLDTSIGFKSCYTKTAAGTAAEAKKCNTALIYKGCFYSQYNTTEGTTTTVKMVQGCLTAPPTVLGKTLAAGECVTGTGDNADKTFCYCDKDNCNKDKDTTDRNSASVGTASIAFLSALVLGVKLIH